MIIGQANIKAGTILIDAINQKQDTIPHEYAHHYVAWFKNTPIIQEGIKRFGSEEALVQAVGEQSVRQKGEAYNLWKSFTIWLQKVFSNREILQIITDGFLSGKNLNEIGYGKTASKFMIKDGLPVKIPKTGITYKTALDDMYDDLMLMSGHVPENITKVAKQMAQVQMTPLDYKAMKLRTADGLFTKIAQINNANKATKLDDLTTDDVRAFFKSLDITVKETEGETPVLLLGKTPLNVERLYDTVKEYMKENTKNFNGEEAMNKQMKLYDTSINARNMFNALASMLDINQRKALYFKSKGFDTNVLMDVYGKRDTETQMPKLNFNVLELYARERVMNKWDISSDEVDAGIINFKTIMENC
jgi:hypothetical protein